MRRRFATLATLALLPFGVASCGDSPPPVKGPAQPASSAQQPLPGLPGQQIGMTDAPSSARPGEVPDAAPRPTMGASASGTYQQALGAFAAGDLLNARTLFQRATQEDPRAHQAFYSLGVVQARLRDAGAGASYRQAFTIVPDYEPAIIAYAMLLARKNQLSDAERVLTEKRGQMPKSAAIAATLAEIKSLQKDTGAAQRIAQEALKINPDYRPAMVIIARDHFRNRRLDLAIYALQAVLDGSEPISENPPRDKDNPEALLLRGLIYREQGNRAGAMDQFKKAVTRRPDLVEARVAYSMYLLEAGNAEEALPLLEGAVKFDSESVPAHLYLGDAYRLLTRYADAKREFEWVLARDASLAQVHYDLGLLYLFAPSIPGMTAKQQVSEAMKELKRFQEIRPKDTKDDSDELLNRAKVKEGELDAASKAATPVPGAPPAKAPPAAGSAAPPGSAKAPPAAGSAAPVSPAPGSPGGPPAGSAAPAGTAAKKDGGA